MNELKLSPSDGSVVFGQLLGMADHLTYPLGQLCGEEGGESAHVIWPHPTAQEGYQANKVLPYGPIQEVLPYLSRRAQENRGIMLNAQVELKLYQSELKKRLIGRYTSN